MSLTDQREDRYEEIINGHLTLAGFRGIKALTIGVQGKVPFNLGYDERAGIVQTLQEALPDVPIVAGNPDLDPTIGHIEVTYWLCNNRTGMHGLFSAAFKRLVTASGVEGLIWATISVVSATVFIEEARRCTRGELRDSVKENIIETTKKLAEWFARSITDMKD